MVAYGSFALDQHTPKWPGSSSHAACPEGLRALIFAVPAFSQGPALGLSFRALSWGFEVYGQWSKYLVAKFIQNNLFDCWGLYFYLQQEASRN